MPTTQVTELIYIELVHILGVFTEDSSANTTLTQQLFRTNDKFKRTTDSKGVKMTTTNSNRHYIRHTNKMFSYIFTWFDEQMINWLCLEFKLLHFPRKFTLWYVFQKLRFLTEQKHAPTPLKLFKQNKNHIKKRKKRNFRETLKFFLKMIILLLWKSSIITCLISNSSRTLQQIVMCVYCERK